jgi:hypothetical protein
MHNLPPTFLRGVIALSFCVAAMPAARAKAWPSNLATWADCLPESEYRSQPASLVKTCATADASAYAEASFTSLKAAITTTAVASVGHYFAAASISDSVLVTPDDAGLLGSNGFVRFTAAIDGQASGAAGAFILVWHGIYDATYNAHSLQSLRITSNHTGTPVNNASFSNTVVDTTVWWDVPVVFGEGSSYEVALTAVARGPNATADFSRTFSLKAVQALDASGQQVAASYSAGSGALLPVMAVPEAQSLALMLAGLGGLGLLLRRRGRA